MKDDSELWENRTLGCSEEHVEVVSKEVQDEFNKTMGLTEVSFLIPTDIHEKIITICKKYGINPQSLLREAIRNYVKKI